MSKYNGAKVKEATAHGTIFVANVGQLGPTLSATPTASNKGVSMVIDEPFLVLTATDKTGKKLTVPVPLANISHMVLAEDVPSTKE